MRLLQTQESVNPYQRITAASTTGTTTNSAGDTVDLVPTRAVLVTSDLSGITFTFADGSSEAINCPAGVHQFAVTKVSNASNVFFLY